MKLGIGIVATLISATVWAADLAPKGREILVRNQNSIVTISALSKMDMGSTGLPIKIGGLDESQESSCNGVVIDASGLTVVSYSALNPMEKLAGGISISVSGGGEETSEALKPKSQLSRIQMRLADGTEVPARLVLKDKELDLAFLVPDPKQGDKAPQFTPVKLATDATAKELDDVVVIARHAKNLGYQPIVSVGHVTSVTTKPRTMYDLSATTKVAAFLMNGQLLGVAVTVPGEGSGIMSMRETKQLVLSVTEILKLAEQAKKAATKKTD